MTSPDETRITLRRRTYDLKEAVGALLDSVEPFDTTAALHVRRAGIALFEAWTVLCTPPDQEEDD